MKESTTAPQYVGGIAETGVMYLQEFVAEGGGLLCLDSSCAFAIDYFDLPIRNVLADLERDAFFCPGSILRVNLDTNSPIAYGADSRAAAYFAHSYAFEVIEDTTATARIGPTLGEPKTVAEYDSTVTLLSGWILGEEHLQGKAAIVSNAYGKGQTVLYGFRVQHRGQPHGTFRLLFNGILFSDNEGLQ